MANFYNNFAALTIQGTPFLDLFYAFTNDDNFDHARADGLVANFSWTSSITGAGGVAYTINATNMQVSYDVYFSNGGTDVLYGSNLNDAIFYNNGVFANGVGGINGIQQFDMAGGNDVADFSGHDGGASYTLQLTLRGGTGNDTLISGSNNDFLFGDADNDVLIGNSGGDLLDGGTGDDILSGDDTGSYTLGGRDTLRGQAGNDTLYGGVNRDTLDGGTDNDVLYGGINDDWLYGGTGNDTMYGDDTGGIGFDQMFGDDGDDLMFGGGGVDSVNGGAGTDTVNGGDGNDTLRGGTGNDRAIGGAGNDIIDGDADIDTAVYTGNRNDYQLTLNPDGSYQLTDTRAGAVNEGSDTLKNIEFFEFADGIVAVNNLDNPPVITSNGGGATAATAINENTTFVTIVTATDVDVNQTLTYMLAGGADAGLFTINVITGELRFIAGPDFENAIDANGDGIYDVIVQAFDGIIGTNQRLAVSINDVADGAPPIIVSNGGAAAATVDMNENGINVTTVVATDANGTVPTYRIVGGADAALFTLDVVTGALRFITPQDFENPQDANHDNIYDVVVEATDGLNGDRQKISVAVKNVNDNAPVIVSNANVTVDENSAVATTVVVTDADGSGPGFDSQFSISGGVDAGLFSINSVTGVLTFLANPDFENAADAGHDNVYNVIVTANDGAFSAQQALAITVANINDNAPVITTNGGGATAVISVAENGTAVTTVQASDADGSVATYRISGGIDAGRFTINAATGALTFTGAPDFENPEDADLNNHYLVEVEASDGLLVDVQSFDITVTDVLDTGRTITGTAVNDVITPSAVAALRTTALDDTVYGLAGNDVIDGGGGADIMDGGAGNDTFYINMYSEDGRSFNDDRAIEILGGGVDRAMASVTYRLATEIENLTLTGTAAIGGTGNELVNQMVGNSGNNQMFGGGGNDTIVGNDGADDLFGEDGNDILVGGNGQDVLRGSVGNDKHDGGTGADQMQGEAGDDTYIVETYSEDGNATNDDIVTELANGGTDTVTASVSYRLTADVENLILSGTLAIDGTGNVLANSLTGNAANNILSGLDGNDKISSLAGDDMLYGEAGSDILDGGVGNDTVSGGDASDSLKGSAGLDWLSGGLGKDTLTGGTEADTFAFNFGDTTLNTNLDRITDFVASTGDRIDLDGVLGGLAASAYAEAAIVTNTFADALVAARTLMSTTVGYVFIAGTTDGFLFWDGAGQDGLPDQSIAMTGVNTVGLFSNDWVV